MADSELDAGTARRRLYETMNADLPFEEKAERALELGESYLDVEGAYLAEIDPGNDYWRAVIATDGGGLPQGSVLDLGETYCQHVVAEDGTVAVADAVGSDVIGDPERSIHGLACYHGTALTVDGELYGTCCFVSRAPREPFTQDETMFAELVARMLEHEHRAERAAAERERLDGFAAALTHDLRNPLGVAAGRLDLAREECDSEHLDGVETALDRIDALVEDALTLAREGGPVTDHGLVDIGRLARDRWETVRTGAARLETPAGNVVRADPDRLGRLLENLFRNALEHGVADGDASGGLTVTVGDLSDGFYVADDGAGIPAERREEVFDPGVSTDREGTGLGLSIVRQVADAHGWTVRATEGEAGGARFEVREVHLDEC